jgi:ribonuclease HII
MSARCDGRQGRFDWHRPGPVAGVDEAGRGPLAGPVVAAAVILDPSRPIAGLGDSKTLSAARREALDREIRDCSLAFGLGEADAAEIDAFNILRACLLAMRRAVAALGIAPAHVVVDGDRCPDLGGLAFTCTVEAMVRADATVAQVSAASILAKVARDRMMCELDRHYPGYGFAKHKGYATAAHVLALRRLGPSAVHRRSFRPVQSSVPR